MFFGNNSKIYLNFLYFCCVTSPFFAKSAHSSDIFFAETVYIKIETPKKGLRPSREARATWQPQSVKRKTI